MIGWLKTNRLKAASVASVSGDVFMGLTGGVGFFNASFDNSASVALTAGGVLAVIGHGALLFWGKGAKDKTLTAHKDVVPPPALLKPFFPWRYPLDFAFSLFIICNVLCVAAGIYMDNYALSLSGGFASIASAIGWLWPAEKPIGRFTSMQVTSMCYSLGTFNHFIAGFWSMNILIILSACGYLTCNLILYTVRKENQSAFTQEHEV